jgi:hypothetical protein
MTGRRGLGRGLDWDERRPPHPHPEEQPRGGRRSAATSSWRVVGEDPVPLEDHGDAADSPPGGTPVAGHHRLTLGAAAIAVMAGAATFMIVIAFYGGGHEVRKPRQPAPRVRTRSAIPGHRHPKQAFARARETRRRPDATGNRRRGDQPALSRAQARAESQGNEHQRDGPSSGFAVPVGVAPSAAGAREAFGFVRRPGAGP